MMVVSALFRFCLCMSLLFSLILSQNSFSQQNKVLISAEKIVYKKIDSTLLNLHIYKPLKFHKDSIYNCIVFFHGGGWNNGSPKMFKRQSMYFASRGMIAIAAEYRIKSKHKTTPFEAVEDAKSAIRFVRKNAKELNINPTMIAAGGGSAGGHLAAACGNIKGLDSPKENLTISSVPNALVLLNPVIDNGPNSFGYRRFKNRYQEISPIHNILKGAPSTIILSGTEDKIIPVTSLKAYQTKMQKIGSRCDLVLYENVGHAFFAKPPVKYFIETTFEIDLFLKSLSYLKGNPTIKKQYNF
jgi:acetyl esterase/lipase